MTQRVTRSINDNSDTNGVALNKANIELIRDYKKEKAFWRMKFGIKLFNKGEINSKFFHSIIKSGREGLP